MRPIATNSFHCAAEEPSPILADTSMAWSTLDHSIAEVDHAGDVLIDDTASATDQDAAIEVVGNWRSCHAFPLNTMQMGLRRAAEKLDPHATVAQRIKRLPAITNKLRWLRRLKLSELQDIGGCRAVVSTSSQVERLRDAYVRGSRARHTLLAQTDYLQTPRATGYRGIHLIYSYQSDTGGVHNGRKIELQLRSRLQHAWATAVETVGLFSKQYLKSNRGDPRWLRFFALMGSAIALRERAAPVPGTPAIKELLVELKRLASELDVRKKLAAYSDALQVMEPSEGAHFLLMLDADEEQLSIVSFQANQRLEANERYLASERANAGKPGRDSVLVSVESAKSLRKAFPNYYADTKLFLDAMTVATSTRSRQA